MTGHMVYDPALKASRHRLCRETPRDIFHTLVEYVNRHPDGVSSQAAAKEYNMSSHMAGYYLGTLARKKKIARKGPRKGEYRYLPLGAMA